MKKNDEAWHRIVVRARQRDAVTRQRLLAIIEEHQRNNPHETALALAWTIHELRGNFERLRHAIGPAIEGKGHLGLWPHGPHKDEHVRRLTKSA